MTYGASMSTLATPDVFMDHALKLASEKMQTHRGGPFGAVIVTANFPPQSADPRCDCRYCCRLADRADRYGGHADHFAHRHGRCANPAGRSLDRPGLSVGPFGRHVYPLGRA